MHCPSGWTIHSDQQFKVVFKNRWDRFERDSGDESFRYYILLATVKMSNIHQLAQTSGETVADNYVRMDAWPSLYEGKVRRSGPNNIESFEPGQVAPDFRPIGSQPGWITHELASFPGNAASHVRAPFGFWK